MTPSATPARFSVQTRPIHPEAGADVHPRCREMAEAMREGRDTYKGLTAAGFSPSEINLHYERAHALALELSVRQVAASADSMEDVVQKAREAIPNRPPLPRGIEETQDTLVRWGLYCQARAALTLYPWSSLREQCLALLRRYLDRSAMFTSSKNTAITLVADSLPKVMQ
ncbi:MAG: hypothetical protein WBA36_03655 [Mesorhizobium sp.]